jgi:hypothetical protein
MSDDREANGKYLPCPLSEESAVQPPKSRLDHIASRRRRSTKAFHRNSSTSAKQAGRLMVSSRHSPRTPGLPLCIVHCDGRAMRLSPEIEGDGWLKKS